MQDPSDDGSFFYFMDMKVVNLMIVLVVFLLGCSEPTERIESKLDPYLQEDLKFMVAETIRSSKDTTALSPEPYYRVKDFRLFDGAEARIYAAYAEVDFFIYKDLALHEKRKYRYDVSTRKWDRYFKEFKFGRDTIPD